MPNLTANRNHSPAADVSTPPPASAPAAPRRLRTTALIVALALAASVALAALLGPASTPGDTGVLDATVTEPASSDCAVPTVLARTEGVSVAELCDPGPPPTVPDLRMR